MLDKPWLVDLSLWMVN